MVPRPPLCLLPGPAGDCQLGANSAKRIQVLGVGLGWGPPRRLAEVQAEALDGAHLGQQGPKDNRYLMEKELFFET